MLAVKVYAAVWRLVTSDGNSREKGSKMFRFSRDDLRNTQLLTGSSADTQTFHVL